MRWRGVCRLPVCVCLCVCKLFAGIATTTPKITRSLPNLHRMVTTWARIQFVLKVEVKVKGHVIWAFLCRSRKSLLVAGEWPDCDQTCTRWSPGQLHSGCAQGQGQGQMSRDTGTFVLDLKSHFLAGKQLDCDQTCTR